MDMNRFYVENGKVALNTYEIVVRQYSDLEKNEYFDTRRYVNDKEAYELEVNYVPKHRLLEIVSKTAFDNSEYSWMEGIELRTADPQKEIADIVSYGSIEAYKASLPQAQDEFNLDMDYRMSKMELGL